MTEQLIEGQEKTPAEQKASVFTDMAARIKLNDDAFFGGAFVIVPPKDAGDTVQTLILDAQQEPIQFWKLLMEKAKDTVTALEVAARAQGFGR